MKSIAVINQKGGVGKTTSVVNIASALAMSGSKVIAIDLDPQAHLTIHLGVDFSQVEFGSYSVLMQSCSFEQALKPVRENLWLVAASIDLVGAESELVSVVGRETILYEAIASVKDKFDYLIIDCPPSLGLLTLNALAAVDEIIIPLQPHFLALQGLGKLLETVSLVHKRINKRLKVSAVLLCMFDSRTSLSNEVKSDIEQFLKSNQQSDCPWSQAEVVPAYIRRNVKLAEAPGYGKTIFEYDETCHGAADYRAVADYIRSKTASPAPQPQPQTQPIPAIANSEQNPTQNIS